MINLTNFKEIFNEILKTSISKYGTKWKEEIRSLKDYSIDFIELQKSIIYKFLLTKKIINSNFYKMDRIEFKEDIKKKDFNDYNIIKYEQNFLLI